MLSASQDPFFAANMYSNFGELGENVKAIVDELQGVQGSARAAESIEDLQNVVQNMPEIRKRCCALCGHCVSALQVWDGLETCVVGV